MSNVYFFIVDELTLALPEPLSGNIEPRHKMSVCSKIPQMLILTLNQNLQGYLS